MYCIISRTFLSMANDKELIPAKNWADIIHHFRQSLLEYKAMNVERQCRIFVEPWSDSIPIVLSWLYTYRFSHLDMFVHYFVRMQTNYYTLLTISPISFIFYSARSLTWNLPYNRLWCFVKIPIAWRERRNARWEKWLTRWFTNCNLYTSHFANIQGVS